MVHRSMRNDSRVADETVYKERWLVLGDFLFFSLYSFSCIARNSTTLDTFLILVPVLVPRYELRVLALQHLYHLHQIPPVTPDR